MERTYTSGTHKDIEFFVGVEIEKTPAYGKKTLFVVGVHPVQKILDLYEKYQCEHVYMGANQSFTTKDIDIDEWDSMILTMLKRNMWVTLDFDVSDAEWVCESGYAEHDTFIPQISVKIPYADQFGYNTMIKIDDKDFGASNFGVWCHPLRSLQTRESFTHWSEYGKDEIIGETK